MLSPKLHHLVIEYLNSVISLEDLEDAYTPHLRDYFSRDIDSDSDSDLIAEIEYYLSEMSNGMMSEEELKAALANKLSGHTVRHFYSSPATVEIEVEKSSSNRTGTTISSRTSVSHPSQTVQLATA